MPTYPFGLRLTTLVYTCQYCGRDTTLKCPPRLNQIRRWWYIRCPYCKEPTRRTADVLARRAVEW